MYQKYLEPIIEEFTTGEYYREVYNAKQEYFEKAGIVYEDDAEFEQRMCIFMDWYLFERDLPGVDLPPIKYYFRKNKDHFSNEELNIYRDFCSTIHSIFRLKRFTWNSKGLVVQDLFSNKSYTVDRFGDQQGFARGDIFEARIIPFKGGLRVFARVLLSPRRDGVLHPGRDQESALPGQEPADQADPSACRP